MDMLSENLLYLIFVKILKIYNNNYIYNKMSKNSKKHKKNFNSQYQKLYKVYNKLIKKN